MALLNPTAPSTSLAFGKDTAGPLRLGVTGGIGSGKSVVARLFGVLGAPLYNADARAKALMEEDAALMDGIKGLFGVDSYQAGGRLNRVHLAARAFGDAALSRQLNALVHPAVEADYEAWASLPRPGIAYTVKEAALLFEAGTYRRVHFVLNVSAPESIRIARTLARDPQRSRAQVENIIGLQMSEGERIKLSHLHIENDDATSLIVQVEEIDKFLRNQRRM